MNSQRFFLTIAELTWSKVFGVGLIVVASYYFTIYDDGKDVSHQLSVSSQRATDAERRLKETKEAMADTEAFEKALRQNEIQFEKVLEYLPQDTNANELTRMVSSVAQQSQVRVKSTTPVAAIERKDFYEMTRIDMGVQGKFSELVSFLSSLSRIPRLMTFDKLDLVIETSGAAEGQVPEVNLTATLAGYRYLKDSVNSSAAPGVAPVKGAPGAK